MRRYNFSAPMTYEDFLKLRRKYDGKSKCYVYDCKEAGIYEGGDSRCYCPMCEKHANMSASYKLYLHCIIGECESLISEQEAYEKAKEKSEYWNKRLETELEKQYGREFSEIESNIS